MIQPARLYELCLKHLLPVLEKQGEQLHLCSSSASAPLDKLAKTICEDFLDLACNEAQVWKNAWIIFLTPKLSSAILKWDKDLLEFVRVKCKNLRRIFFKWITNSFEPTLLKSLPISTCSVDFDGDLYYRGKSIQPKCGSQTWLPEAEIILKYLSINRKEQPSLNENCLVELHFGSISVSADQLITVLQLAPNIKLLRHYQMVSALYKQHAECWKTGRPLPKYKLTNLDADFSHVVRCRMAPQAVLPGDAMRLTTQLCPEVISVRVRIDCSTPHDILVPLTGIHHLKELSIVCVTSGERCNLDFTDITPILEAHGESSLVSLELKVIEEVESHQLLQFCPRLETLILSGCGFTSPTACGSFMCAVKPKYLRRLRLLFYADGDDFSWTHNVPQCFWKATLSSKFSRKSKLIGLFLESPRISADTAEELWPSSQGQLYPDLQVVSFFRYSEITLDNIKNITAGAPLYYLRVSDCERIHSKRLKQMCSTPNLTIYSS